MMDAVTPEPPAAAPAQSRGSWSGFWNIFIFFFQTPEKIFQKLNLGAADQAFEICPPFYFSLSKYFKNLI